MTQPVVEDPIVTSIDQDTIDAILSAPEKGDWQAMKRKEGSISFVQNIIYGSAEGSQKLTDEENIILRYAIQDACERHKGDKRNVFNLPYINHPVSVGRILHSQGEDLTTIVAGLLHDTVENYVEGVIKKEFRRELLAVIEAIEDTTSKRMYDGKTSKKLNADEKKKLKAATELDIEKAKQDLLATFKERE